MKKLLLLWVISLLSISGWANNGIRTKTNVPKKNQIMEYPSLQRHSLMYYDYDGDGVMEMFGYCENNYKEVFCLMNDNEIITNYGTDVYLWDLYYGGHLTMPITIPNRHPLKYVNGSGQIMIGPYILKDTSWKRDYYGYIFDIDNDGRMDVVKTTSSFARQLYDGSFIVTTPSVESDSAYIAYLKSKEKKYDPLEVNIVYHTTKTVKTNYFSQTVDLNGDGYMDFLSDDGKSAFIYLDENSYYQICFSNR